MRNCVKPFRTMGKGSLKPINSTHVRHFCVSVAQRVQSLSGGGSREDLGTATQTTISDILLGRTRRNEMVSSRGCKTEKSSLFYWFCFLFIKNHRNYNTCGWERFSRNKKVNHRGQRVDTVRIGSSAPRKELPRGGSTGCCSSVTRGGKAETWAQAWVWMWNEYGSCKFS